MKCSNNFVIYYSFLSSSWNKKNIYFEEVERPMIVQVFVDLCNMLLSLYRIRQRTKKFYFHIVYYLLGISVTNGWLLYTDITTKKVFLKKTNYQCWNFKLLQQTIYDLLGNWRQHQDHHGEGHHSPPLLKHPSKSTGRQQFQILLIIHVLINLIIFLYSKRSSNAAENAEHVGSLQKTPNTPNKRNMFQQLSFYKMSKMWSSSMLAKSQKLFYDLSYGKIIRQNLHCI